jgi:hypothetical protein
LEHVVEQWTFQDEEKVLARIRREYGQALLEMLPTPARTDLLTLGLCEAYMTFTLLTLRAVRAHHVSRVSDRLVEEKRSLWRQACAMRSAWGVLHRHLVALQLRELLDWGPRPSVQEAALLSERCIEALTDNIDLGWAKED